MDQRTPDADVLFAEDAAAATDPRPASAAGVTFAVPGLPRAAVSVLSCCALSPSSMLVEALHALSGVRLIDVDEHRGRVSVVYDPRRLAPADLRAALTRASFPAAACWLEAHRTEGN